MYNAGPPPPYGLDYFFQLRRVSSTVHLTGKQSATTKRQMIDLFAPPKGEVVVRNGYGSGDALGEYLHRSKLKASSQESGTEGMTEEELDESVSAGRRSAASHKVTYCSLEARSVQEPQPSVCRSFVLGRCARTGSLGLEDVDQRESHVARKEIAWGVHMTGEILGGGDCSPSSVSTRPHVTCATDGGVGGVSPRSLSEGTNGPYNIACLP